MNLLQKSATPKPQEGEPVTKREPLTTESAVRQKVHQEQREKANDQHAKRATSWKEKKKAIDAMSTDEVLSFIKTTGDTTATGSITSRLSPKDYATIVAACSASGFTMRELLVKAARDITRDITE